MLVLKSAMSSFGSSSVQSVGGGTAGVAQFESTDLVPSLTSPTSSHDATPTTSVPPWMRELASSNVNRHSRASSIISTRTRFSTTTLQEDSRSIDINVGGQYFRISRDGSQINDAPPPPYPGSPNSTTHHGGRLWPSRAFEQYHAGGSNLPNVGQPPTTRQRASISRLDTSTRANILDVSEVDMPSPVSGGARGENPSQDDAAITDSATPARNRSYRTGPETIDVPEEARRARTVSQNDLPTVENQLASVSSPLRRRNGVRLPSLITHPLAGSRGMSSYSRAPIRNMNSTTGSPLRIRSAGPVLSTLDNEDPPQSPTYIGRDAVGIFPLPNRTNPAASIAGEDTSMASSTSTISHAVNLPETDGSDERNTPLPMDTENDISLHYARLMRRLDKDHRKALHLKDKELAQYRERLNEVDTVYRQELRARDFIIEDLKKRLDHLEETTEVMIEKARNEVEDVWESRWKDRLKAIDKLTERPEMESRRDD